MILSFQFRLFAAIVPLDHGGGMKRFTGVIFSFIFFSLSSQAQYFNYSDYMDEVAELANRIQLQQETAFSIGGTKVADQCVAFMNKEMFLGEMGRSIFEALKENKKSLPLLMKGGNIFKHCPKFPQMEEDQKMMVWVMLLTMMAHFESTCNIKAKAKGPNGTAKGFFQLHAGQEQNYDELGFCVKNASSDEKKSAKCVLGMLERQMDREKGQVFSQKSYWEVLRPGGPAQKADDIQRTLKKSSLCSPLTT